MGDHALDLVDRLLAYPPTDRLAASEALQHAFFAGHTPLSSSSEEVKEEDTQIVARWIVRCLG
jgi:serine/threonine protein kinase